MLEGAPEPLTGLRLTGPGVVRGPGREECLGSQPLTAGTVTEAERGGGQGQLCHVQARAERLQTDGARGGSRRNGTSRVMRENTEAEGSPASLGHVETASVL